MLHHCMIESFLDLGDLGRHPANVEGHVETTGLFGPGDGYLQITITKVTLFLKPDPNHDRFVEINVTHLISKVARSHFEELLEVRYDRDRID